MAIYPPVPFFSDEDKKLLFLMGKLLVENLQPGHNSPNVRKGDIVLTDSEAFELVELLDRFLNSKEFLEASVFCEEISKSRSATGMASLREIYLSARKRRGRSRAMASLHWSEFQHRLGIVKDPGWHTATPPMTYEHFLEMEKRLLFSSMLNPLAVHAIVGLMRRQKHSVEDIRSRNRDLPSGILRGVLSTPLNELKFSLNRQMSVSRVAAAVGLVADTAVLFTTRDWGVAGTLSAMASCMMVVALPDKDTQA